jgi:hypothetical protein
MNDSLPKITNVNGLITRIASFGDVIVYILIALAVVYIVWTTVRYFIAGKEGADRNAAGMQILWGIVGLFIIISLWGLVNILINTFDTNSTLPTQRFPKADFVNDPNGGGNSGGGNSNRFQGVQPNQQLLDAPGGACPIGSTTC